MSADNGLHNHHKSGTLYGLVVIPTAVSNIQKGDIMIKLGDEVKDTVSGFQGVAVSRSIFLQGCSRVCVQPPVGEDGKLPDTAYFDEPQLVVLTSQMVTTTDDILNGGPDKYLPTARYGE